MAILSTAQHTTIGTDFVENLHSTPLPSSPRSGYWIYELCLFEHAHQVSSTLPLVYFVTFWAGITP
jgi:hypothetical protein